MPSPPPSLAALRASLPEAVASRLLCAADLPSRSSRALHEDLLPTGAPPLDRLLGGGLPKGLLVELCGSRSTRSTHSTGRFTLGLHALASATRSGEAAAFVDLGDHLDPQAAAAEGVVLSRLLWLRPRKLKEALLAAETVLDTGFTLVVLNLGIRPPRLERTRLRLDAAWVRLARAARAHQAALLVLSPFHSTGTAAGLVIAADETRPCWSRGRRPRGIPPGPPLLAGLSAQLTLRRRRGDPAGETSLLRLHSRDALLPKTREPAAAPDAVDGLLQEARP